MLPRPGGNFLSARARRELRRKAPPVKREGVFSSEENTPFSLQYFRAARKAVLSCGRPKQAFLADPLGSVEELRDGDLLIGALDRLGEHGRNGQVLDAGLSKLIVADGGGNGVEQS